MNAGNVFFAKKYEVIIATHDQLKHTFFILYLNRRDHHCLYDYRKGHDCALMGQALQTSVGRILTKLAFGMLKWWGNPGIRRQKNLQLNTLADSNLKLCLSSATSGRQSRSFKNQLLLLLQKLIYIQQAFQHEILNSFALRKKRLLIFTKLRITKIFHFQFTFAANKSLPLKLMWKTQYILLHTLDNTEPK